MRVRIPNRLMLIALLCALGASPAAAQEWSWLNQLDGNDDGRVTWKEFRRGMPSYKELDLDRNGRFHRGGRFDRGSRMDRTGRFERRDGMDRTGRFERRDDRDSRGHGSVARFDRNRDGRVTRSEYDEYLWAEFRRYDRNGDGVIGRRELRGRDSGPLNRDRRPDDRDRWG